MSPNGNAQPQFIMDDVKLLFNGLTAPESGVKFVPPQRANPTTIQSQINPPTLTWNWPDQPSRLAQTVGQDDVGKYGIQLDANILFRLSGVNPTSWQPVQTEVPVTWTWLNLAARSATEQSVTQNDIGKIGIQTDINTLYQLTSATPPIWQIVPNPANTSSPFELSTGAADADSYHDFYRLQIAFEDVWAELLDGTILGKAEQLYAKWDALMDQNLDDTGINDRLTRFADLPTDSSGNPVDISGASELQDFINSLKALFGLGGSSGSGPTSDSLTFANDLADTLTICKDLFNQLNGVANNTIVGQSVGGDSSHYIQPDGTPSDPNLNGLTRQAFLDNAISNVNTLIEKLKGSTASKDPDALFPEIEKLLQELDGSLKEPYQFDVFAPSSINYGLLLNYRQHWKPQSYQVGNLVSTIPLAPQETRRYTTKTVVKKTRNVKEIDDSVRSGKDESSDTWRIDSEIVDRAKNQTNFQKNASGSFGNDNLYKVSAGMQQGQDQSVESAQTKREFHESVVKSAQEYRNEHRMEITTEESREDESTSYREIRNPNDELTVTYLFYELQRRYLVDEALHKVTPVVLVANNVPAPHEVDQAWLLRHDWVIKRTILDDSFLPALEYLSSDYTGEELTLQVLGLAVEQQKAVVDRISQQVQLANAAVNTATLGLENAETQEVQDLQTAEKISMVKSFFDPLGITQTPSDGNSDRAKVDFAKDALNRAQTKVNQLVSDLKAETTALQAAIDKYTKAATHHFSMLADIDRLRVHVKDNIIYYMQAIWTYEPSDQRFFRLCNVEVPVFTHNTTVNFARTKGLAQIDDSVHTYEIAYPTPTLSDPTLMLHQVADIENLIGFKGNYMIFPMVNFNYMTWYMMQDYLHIDDTTGVTAQDPDPLAGLSLDQLKDAMSTVYVRDPGSFSQDVVEVVNGQNVTVNKQAIFEEVMRRLLSTQNPEMVIVPSNSLYIEALPGTHPLLEDFKLIHRAIDVKKAQAEARHAELENLRLAGRLASSEYGDPDIDKVVVVGTGQNVTVDAGQ